MILISKFSNKNLKFTIVFTAFLFLPLLTNLFNRFLESSYLTLASKYIFYDLLFYLLVNH